MADQVDLNIASKESVALDIANRILRSSSEINPKDPEFKDKYLDLYAECLHATGGYRQVK
jgi:hypothetical protein